MARLATGLSIVEIARSWLVEAKTVEELRRAQAVLFPLEFGLSMEETARAIGLSKGWTCQLRRSAITQGDQGQKVVRAKRGQGRGRAWLSDREEKDFLLPFVEKAERTGILIVSEIGDALHRKLGKSTSKATVYNLLHRHGWRKSAPDKRHPEADVATQEDWKKNFLNSCGSPTKTGKAKGVGSCA